MTQQEETFVPTPKMLDYLETMCEPGLKQTVLALCERADISRQTYYEWITKPGFIEWLHGEYSKRRASRKPGVLNAIEQKALEGDVQAAKVFMQTGVDLEYRPAGSNLSINAGGPVEIVIAATRDDAESE